MIIRLLIMVIVVLLIIVLAAGCTQSVPVPPQKQIAYPEPRLMLDIPDLPPVKPGDDIYRTLGVCRAEYGNVKYVAKGLQGYVRVIHSEKP